MFSDSERRQVRTCASRATHVVADLGVVGASTIPAEQFDEDLDCVDVLQNVEDSRASR